MVAVAAGVVVIAVVAMAAGVAVVAGVAVAARVAVDNFNIIDKCRCQKIVKKDTKS